MTEQELVRRAKDGDQLAFEQLVTDNEKRIYNLCRRMVGDQEDAAELTQEAFLNAWRGLPGFQAESAFSTWLYRLASNVCLDFLRREKRRKSLSLTVVSLDQEEAVELEIPDQRYAPEGELERLEQRQAIRDGLARLSEEHRQVLVLRELSGLSYREIAQLLGVEEGTVKSRIARARGALRKVLVEEGNFFGKAPSKT
ncbi:RNA polymerase sigma factor [uncultured Intestinimonas sp.]|uniref:RNA polymerase sigma factor n=1 Tax=uncultured Intestinimonas sp. TaxID=1689265 RepID=UPI0025E58BF5|nr:sigma-70 family RNA polymerase sigma factor [uncultured Intestinimonas sp.]